MFSHQVAFEIDTEVRKIINDCHEVCEKTLRENKDLVIKIAEALLERETLTSEEIYEIAGMPQPEVLKAEEKTEEEPKKASKKVKEEKESNE
jgi:cell division protease FtsH